MYNVSWWLLLEEELSFTGREVLRDGDQEAFFCLVDAAKNNVVRG